MDKKERARIANSHNWIRRIMGNPTMCEICGSRNNSKRYEWSNKNHKYLLDKKDWQSLCKPCHSKYDIESGLRSYKEYKKPWITSKLKDIYVSGVKKLEAQSNANMKCPRPSCGYEWKSRKENPRCCPLCKRHLPPQMKSPTMKSTNNI